MNSIKNAILIVIFVLGICFLLNLWIKGLEKSGNSKNIEVEKATVDSAYHLMLRDPKGREFTEIRLQAEISMKPFSGGFYLNDIRNNMLIEIDGSGNIVGYRSLVGG